tara:strand:- start:8 stop:835 length:828 start_codon:yes stop_codon:yes gene_type:complete
MNNSKGFGKWPILVAIVFIGLIIYSGLQTLLYFYGYAFTGEHIWFVYASLFFFLLFILTSFFLFSRNKHFIGVAIFAVWLKFIFTLVSFYDNLENYLSYGFLFRGAIIRMAIFLIIAVVITFYLIKSEKIKNIYLNKKVENKQQNLSGFNWTKLLLFFLFLGVAIYGFFVLFFVFTSLNTLSFLSQASGIITILLSLVILATFFSLVYSIYLGMTRKRLFGKFTIFSLWFATIFYLTLSYSSQWNNPLTALIILFSTIWTIYLIKSKRVKNEFIN